MNKKSIIISCLLSAIIIVLYGINEIYKPNYNIAQKAYQVYLNGEVLGLIKSRDELYDYINSKQQNIKDKYDVEYVYPPNGLDIVAINTFDNDYKSTDEIYKRIETADDFTIKGYIVTIKPKEGENITVNVLDKNIFEESLKKFIMAFITEDEYLKYTEGKSEELTDIGQIIDNMYFEEAITIKEGYISIKEDIYIDVESLSQYLLFGKDAKMESYVVALGDNIDSISEKYDLNPQEFIIANPVYRDVNTMLKIGEKVNVTLLNPVITFNYDISQVDENEIPYTTETSVDKTKSVGYREPVRAGITGLELVYQKYKVTNGERSSETNIINRTTIRDMQKEKVVVGPSYVQRPITGHYVDIGGDWGWPTNSGYIITSRFAMRWGRLHAGIDISGTGYASPIYAIADGTVVKTSVYCGKNKCSDWMSGTYVVIEHANNIHSSYLHLSSFNVKVGDVVKKGDRIASMGNSGYVTGTHLHLGLFNGMPGSGTALNPLTTIYKGIK